MATRTSVGSGLWSAAGTWDTGVPVNTDSVVIAAGHTVTFDVDQSGFASGIAGLTLGAGSVLVASTSAGAYYLKMAGNITASGAGAELQAGTAGVAYPTNCTFTIYMNGNYSIDGGSSNTLTCKFYCYDPPVKYLRLISATPKAITGISKEATCTVTCVGHGKSAGDIIYLVNVGGMVELNNLRVRVKTVLGVDSFTIRAYDADVEIDSTYFTTYTSSGYVCPETAEAAGQTVLEVDQDVSADAEWTRSGATVNIDNVARAANSESRSIASVAAGSVTVTAGLTAAKHSSALVVLTSRNVTLQSSSTNITTGIIYRGSGHSLRCAIKSGNTSTVAIHSNGGTIFGGVISGAGSSLYNGSGNIVSGIITGSTNGSYYEAGIVFSGIISGCSAGIRNSVTATIGGIISGCGNALIYNIGTNNSVNIYGCSTGISSCDYCTNSGNIYGCTYAFSLGVNNIVNGCILGCSAGLYYSASAVLHDAVICGNIYGSQSSKLFSSNSVFCGNYADILQSFGLLKNTTLGSTTENTSYNLNYVSGHVSLFSFDHDATAGAFRAWTRGGVTLSTATSPPTGRVRSYQTVCESATYPGWYQREIVVDAGRQLRLRVWLKADAGVEIKAQLVLPTADPLITGTGTGEWQQIGTSDGTWYEYVTSWTNSATYPVTIYARVLSTAASGNGYSDMMWAFDRTPLVR